VAAAAAGGCTEPFIHLWNEAEHEGNRVVFTPTSWEADGGALRYRLADAYYARNGVVAPATLSPEAVRAVADRFDFERCVARGRFPARGFTAALLKAAGVRWRLSPRGTLLPA
jgi:hypothetical protein